MGNALIARMATTALRKGMNLRLNVNVLALCEAQGAVHGVEIEYQGQRGQLHARRGVVLAAGGFAAGALAARYRPHTREHFTMSPPANDGAALRLAAALNAREGADRPSIFLGAGIGADPGRRQRGALPHLVTDRAKPGVIAVNQRAVRFVNESSSYHHFASAMQDAAENAPCFLLCDARAMKRYGLGLARPAPVNNDATGRRWLSAQSRYLAALAQQLGLDAQTLSKTVARYNRDAAQGVDREFAKGGNSYNRAMGDPGHQPDACNAPCSARRSMPSNFIPAIWGPHGAGHHRRCRSSIPKDTPSGAVRGGKRHGFADGRHLSGPRHHPRPGADVWLSRRLPSGTTLHPLIRKTS